MRDPENIGHVPVCVCVCPCVPVCARVCRVYSMCGVICGFIAGFHFQQLHILRAISPPHVPPPLSLSLARGLACSPSSAFPAPFPPAQHLPCQVQAGLHCDPLQTPSFSTANKCSVGPVRAEPRTPYFFLVSPTSEYEIIH